jgi:hypothetical protein
MELDRFDPEAQPALAAGGKPALHAREEGESPGPKERSTNPRRRKQRGKGRATRLLERRRAPEGMDAGGGDRRVAVAAGVAPQHRLRRGNSPALLPPLRGLG